MDLQEKFDIAEALLEKEGILTHLRLSSTSERKRIASNLKINEEKFMAFIDEVAAGNAEKQHRYRRNRHHTVILTDEDVPESKKRKSLEMHTLSDLKGQFFESGFKVKTCVRNKELANQCSKVLNLPIIPTEDPLPELKFGDTILQIMTTIKTPNESNLIYVREIPYRNGAK